MHVVTFSSNLLSLITPLLPAAATQQYNRRCSSAHMIMQPKYQAPIMLISTT